MKIAITALVADAGHTTCLLHHGTLLQNNGIEVRFFGPHENASLCQERNIASTTFQIERPVNYQNCLARYSRAKHFWKEAIFNKWLHVNYFDKVNYYGIRKESHLISLLEEYKPSAILCDNHQFSVTSKFIALKLNCPLLLVNTYGSYFVYQEKDHISNYTISSFSKIILPILKKSLGKIFTEFNKRLNRLKFIADEHIYDFLNHYWNCYINTDFHGLRKLIISSGTGILEKKYLADQIIIDDEVFQVGPIPYTPTNLLSNELSNWLNQDSKPIIYVCLGTMVKGNFPFFLAIIKAALIEGFRLLWSYYEKPWKDSYDSKELRWERWVPQIDILAHENVKLFITHCGAEAIKQALWFCKPVISIPILWDQFYNAWVLEQLCGIASLNWNSITVNQIRSQIKNIQSRMSRFNNICAEYKEAEASKVIFNRVSGFISDR
jgi:hypothetical protein